MAIKCPKCGAEYDVTLFTFGRSIRCDCGAWVDLTVGHQQTVAGDDQVHQNATMPRSTEQRRANTVADEKSKGRWLAFWLVLGHLLIGLIGCAASRSPSTGSLSVRVFVGLVFAQTSLLGLWGSLGTGNWLGRLVGVLVGLTYLGALFCIGYNPADVHLAGMIVFTGLTCAGLLIMARCFGLRIRAISDDRSQEMAAQFSIRQLMLLTLAVACLSTIAKLLGPHVGIGYLLFLLLIAVPFGILGLVTIWAILVTEHLWLGIVAVSLLALLLGYRLAAYPGEPSFWITATMTEASVLIVSLYAIRRCGFRVGRQRKGKAAFVGGELHQEHKCDTFDR